jgi:hypothetical protein
MLLTGHGLKIKTVPIAALPMYFFFAVHTRNGARCRAVWRRRRKAGTDEVKRNKNQSNPPKRKEKKKKTLPVCNNFFSAGIVRLYSVPVFTQTHIYRATVRGTREKKKTDVLLLAERFMGSKDGGDFLRRRRRNSLNINKRI